MNNLEVLYEDNHIIVVVKPHNVLSQSDNTNDEDMLTIVKRYIKEKYNKPGNVYLGLVHRLDRPVGGIMIFARTSKAASRMTEMIQKHQFEKKYLAVINGILKNKEGTLKDYLTKNNDGNTIVTTKEIGKYSELEYKVLEENQKEKLTLVEVNLLTGRHHQIRVQFSSRNYPLYGDQRYGKMDKKQIALWAYKLTIIHPITKEKMQFIYPPKKGQNIWNVFNVHFINSACN
jgi:23S rRNA pseudouridine1911/1915/1917 synthase